MATVLQEPYVVVSKSNMSNVHEEAAVFGSRSEADEYMKNLLNADPAKKGKIQVSPAFQTV
jgi:hypothetical protein